MLNLFSRFSPRANPATTDYPFGSIKNESVPGAKDGTPLDADWGNDMAGFDAALVSEAGITPNNQPDKASLSQRLDALKNIFVRKSLLQDGSANIGGVSAKELVDRSDDFVGVGRNFMQQIKLQSRSVNLYFLGDSTSGPSYPWVLALAEELADIFPTHSVSYRLFLDATNNYGAPTVVSAGTGVHAINIFNASVPGATATYFNSFRRVNLWVDAPDLVIFNYGHNLGSAANSDQIFSFMYSALLDIMGDYPNAEYALTIQNVDTTLIKYTGLQSTVVQNIASLCNLGVIDFRGPFVDAYYAGNIGPLMIDSVHPSQLGQDLMKKIVLRSLLTNKKVSCTPINPLKECLPNLLYNEHFFQWPFTDPLPYGFSTNGFCTASKDLSDYETLGFSLKLTTTSSSLGLLSTDQSSILSKVQKSQGITFAARVKSNTGAGNNAGRVEIDMGTSTASSFGQSQGRGGWMWVSVYATAAQLASATRLVFSVYSGNNSDITKIDRLGFCSGKILTDSQFKFLQLSDYYNPANVIPKTSNDVLTVASNGSVSVSNAVDLYPGFGINLLYLEIGETYTATWKTTVAGASSGAYVRNFGLVGAIRESVAPLGTNDGSGNLLGSLTFTATQTTASIQMEIIKTAGGTSFTVSNISIVKS